MTEIPEFRLLVIEDDPTLVKLLCLLVSQLSMPERLLVADSAETKAEAFAKLNDTSLSYDALFLDLWLPNGQGASIVREFRVSFPKTPIIAISGYDFDECEIITAGAMCFLQKPIEKGAIAKAIAQVMAHRRSHREFAEAGNGLEEAMRTVAESGIIKPPSK